MLKIKETEAAILVNQKEDLIVDQIQFPNELGIGQVLIELRKSGICGSQIGEIDGAKGKDKYLPHLLGHEGCGKVLQIGPGVSHVKEGDLVVLHWKKGEGIESSTPAYKWNGKILNAGWVTTFNKHAIVSENRLTRINQETNLDLATLFGCAITTAFGVVENNAKLKIGESVVVYGAGGIGLNIIQAASMMNCNPIIAVDLFDNRLNLAKEMGANFCLNSRNDDIEAKLKFLLPNNLDVFIDNTGIPEIIKFGYEKIKSDGRLVLVGVPKLNSFLSINTLPIHFGKKIIGSHGGECNPSKDIPRYLELLKYKKFDPNKLITHRYNLSEINLAIASMKKGITAGRIIIDL